MRPRGSRAVKTVTSNRSGLRGHRFPYTSAYTYANADVRPCWNRPCRVRREKSPSPWFLPCNVSNRQRHQIRNLRIMRDSRENGISSERIRRKFTLREWNFLTALIDRSYIFAPVSHFVGLILRVIHPLRFLASTRRNPFATIRYGERFFFIDSAKIYRREFDRRFYPASRQSSFNKRRLRIFIQLQKRAPRRESVNFTVKFLGWWDTRVFKPKSLTFNIICACTSVVHSLSFSLLSPSMFPIFSLFFFVKLLTHVSLLSCIVVVENAS